MPPLRRLAALLALAWCAAAAVGCAPLARQYRARNEERRVYPIVAEPAADSRVDLPSLLDPLALGWQRVTVAGRGPAASIPARPDLDVALLGFRDPRYPELLCGRPQADAAADAAPSGAEAARGLCLGGGTITDEPPAPYLLEFQRQRRDQVQDRLIEASNRACAAFEEDLRAFRADAGFLTGAAAIGLGAAGAMMSGPAPVLSGLSATVLGLGKTFDRSFYQEKTVAVLVKGIDAKRARLLEGARERRPQGPLDYTPEAAVADAMLYHDACTVLSGLDEVDRTLAGRLAEISDRLDAQAVAVATPGARPAPPETAAIRADTPRRVSRRRRPR